MPPVPPRHIPRDDRYLRVCMALQAASFLVEGGTWVVPPPWQPEEPLVSQ